MAERSTVLDHASHSRSTGAGPAGVGSTAHLDGLLVSSFSVGGELFAVDALHVQEVLRSLPTTEVPLAPPEVVGLINLRGQVVTVLDIRHRLGLPVDGDQPPSMNVVVRVGGEPISLIVDEIGDVLALDPGSLEEPPETVDDHLRTMLSGVYPLEDRLLLLLNLDRALAHRQG